MSDAITHTIQINNTIGIEKFTYMGASHGAGVGWHVMLNHGNRINSFVAVVGGPHSLEKVIMIKQDN